MGQRHDEKIKSRFWSFPVINLNDTDDYSKAAYMISYFCLMITIPLFLVFFEILINGLDLDFFNFSKSKPFWPLSVIVRPH